MFDLECVDSRAPDSSIGSKISSTASYAAIKAKADIYVGFLPSHDLERLLEKRPIVLITLAKRLISMLSPLGGFPV